MYRLHIISPPILHSPIALCYIYIFIYIYLASKFGFGLLEMKIEIERKSEGEGKTYLKGERFGCWIRSKQGDLNRARWLSLTWREKLVTRPS